MWSNLLLLVRKIHEDGSFIRNVSITSSWNAAVIVSQFILSPIITRLYSPAEYGVYALFNSVVVNIALFSSLKYTETIVFTETPVQRNNAISLSFALVLIFSIVTFFVVVIFNQPIHLFFGNVGSTNFLYLIPLGVLLTCILEILASLNIKRKNFLNNGFAGFLNNTSARVFNILHALIGSPKSIGLIAGDFLGKLMGIAVVLISYKNFSVSIRNFLRSISVKEMRAVAFKYKSFPLYFLPSSVLIYLSGHLPLYFFQVRYGAAAVGSYALASSMLEIFNRLIPYALSPVFLQKATELKSVSTLHLAERTFKLFGYMLLLATLIFSGFALLGDIVFPFVFGKEWATAGIYVSILAIPYAFNFVAVALSEMYNVMGRQRFLLFNSIINVVLKIISVLIVFYLQTDELEALYIYAIFSSVGGIGLVLGVFIILKYRIWKALALLLLSLATLLVTLFLNGFIN